MISLIESDLPRHAFFCDACGEEIIEKREVCLMCRGDALSEDRIHHVHDRCVEVHLRTHGDGWERIPLLSPRAAAMWELVASDGRRS